MEDSKQRLFADLNLFLTDYRGQCLKLSEKIRWGGGTASGQQISDAVESVQWVCEAFDSLQKIHPQSSFASYWTELRAEIYKSLAELMGYVENKDLLPLADFFEFEVTYWIDKWQEMINQPQTLEITAI